MSEPRRVTLHPGPEDDRPTVGRVKAAACRPSPRSFIATGTIDALEQLCTGTLPESRVEAEDGIDLDAPTVKSIPGE